MAIVASDIVKRLSVVTGSAGDSTAGTPAGALGKYVSTTAITDATVGNVFDDVSGAEAAAGSTEYRCIFILNNHATLTLYAATITLQSETAGGGAITIALDSIAASAKGGAGAQAAQIASETSTPSGVGAFGAGPLTIGDLTPGQVKGVWLKRVVTAGASALNPDGAILRVTGDTLP
jgi:hypothetical protein